MNERFGAAARFPSGTSNFRVMRHADTRRRTRDGKFVATATSNTDDARLFGDGAGLVNAGEQEQDEIPRAGIFPALTRAQCHRESSLSTSFVLATVSTFVESETDEEERKSLRKRQVQQNEKEREMDSEEKTNVDIERRDATKEKERDTDGT